MAQPIKILVVGPEGGHHSLLLKALIDAGLLSFERGTVTHYSVLHDDWCHLLNRQGACDCNPEIVYGTKRYLYSDWVK